MSSQADGVINIPASYNPQREHLTNYRAKSIEPNGFSSWTSEQMYKSSYAQFHSKVLQIIIAIGFRSTKNRLYSWISRIYTTSQIIKPLWKKDDCFK